MTTSPTPNSSCSPSPSRPDVMNVLLQLVSQRVSIAFGGGMLATLHVSTNFVFVVAFRLVVVIVESRLSDVTESRLY